MNKAKQVRAALGLTQTRCGELLLGTSGKSAYDQWSQWENGQKLSNSTESLFNVILILAVARDLKTHGAHKALDLVLKMIREQ